MLTLRIILLPLLFIIISPLSASTNKLRIMSYNLENLWDSNPLNTPLVWRRYISSNVKLWGGTWPRSLQYSDFSLMASNWYKVEILRAKVRNFLHVLELAGLPEIVALQEIESSGNRSLVWDMPGDNASLRGELKRRGYHYLYLGMQEEKHPTSISSAFISKLKLRTLPSVKVAIPGRASHLRDIQVMSLNTGSQKIMLFNSHWKSRGGDFAKPHEVAAAALLERLQAELKYEPRLDFILLGDFNCPYHEGPIKSLYSLTQNLWFDLAYKDRWEYVFSGIKEHLSHVLVSKSLLTKRPGLSYKKSSFKVVGQYGEAAKYLLNAGGKPYRWQIQRHKGGNFIHIGEGYSDHLPLLFTLTRESQGVDLQHDYSEKSIRFADVKGCTASESIDYKFIDFSNRDNYYNKCVKIIPDERLKLKKVGRYDMPYVSLPLADDLFFNLGITMHRSRDWRPNVSDPRVSWQDAAIDEGEFSYKQPHPRSNRCYVEKVLRGGVGYLDGIVGRIFNKDGFLSIHAIDRSAIKLSGLTLARMKACPWD